MARPSWLVDSKRIATKIKSASGTSDPSSISWKSNPTKTCPNCLHVIDNSDVIQEWPGLPRGVKFDPSDGEIIWHLLAKVGVRNLQSHPFIDEFIPTVDKDDGICYTHPKYLPGVKEDGTVSHFFHKAIKAYNTGTRKRRKIHGDDFGYLRWHKTGRTKPVLLDGSQEGMKKIMVLYVSPMKGGKAEKTNWVMHQYHLGNKEDEGEGEYVVSKVFYQLQQIKQTDTNEQETSEATESIIPKVDPVTPKSVTPEPPRAEKRSSNLEMVETSFMTCIEHDAENEIGFMEDEAEPHVEISISEDHIIENEKGEEKNGNEACEDHKWWDSESQYLLDSQQLVEGLSLCDELLQSQSPNRDAKVYADEQKIKPLLSDYAHLGPESLKKDLEECQNLDLDPANIELDTPPDFRLSQLEFCSQDSYIAWGGSKFVPDAAEHGS